MFTIRHITWARLWRVFTPQTINITIENFSGHRGSVLYTFGDLDEIAITKTPELPFSSWLHGQRNNKHYQSENTKYDKTKKNCRWMQCTALKSYIVEETWSGPGRVESTWDVTAETEVTSHPTSFWFARDYRSQKADKLVSIEHVVQHSSYW